MSPEKDAAVKDKYLLVAVDESDSSKRAVTYVADFLGGFPGFSVMLFSIVPEPEEDFFDTDEAMNVWIRDALDRTNGMLENYRQILIQSGVAALAQANQPL